MVAAGWEDEVRRLVDAVPPEAAAWNACGYREVRTEVVAGRSIGGVLEAVRIATRRYAKRQRTWFRHQLTGERVTWLGETGDAARDAACRWYEEEGR
jgi:tRNA dimethylallyltransferase